MALNFSAQGDNNKNIEWSILVDEDGDLTLKANAERIIYISSENGILHRYTTFNKELGLKLDENNRIEIAD